MRSARRPNRATRKPPQAVFDRGMAKAYAALYATEPLTPERAGALERELAATPYRKDRQGELALLQPEPDA